MTVALVNFSEKLFVDLCLPQPLMSFSLPGYDDVLRDLLLERHKQTSS